MVTVYRKMTTEPGNDWSCIFCNGLQIFGSMWCGIFVFCLLLFPQNIRKIYKLTQLSLSKFVYFWAQSHLCLLLQKKVFYGKVNIDGSVLKNIQTETTWFVSVCIFLSTEPSMFTFTKESILWKSKHTWLCAQKIYKLGQTRLPQFW